jgi:hypothetical protein
MGGARQGSSDHVMIKGRAKQERKEKKRKTGDTVSMFL